MSSVEDFQFSQQGVRSFRRVASSRKKYTLFLSKTEIYTKEVTLPGRGRGREKTPMPRMLAVSASQHFFILGLLLVVQNGPDAIAGLLADAFEFRLLGLEILAGLIQYLRELFGLVRR